ncbi:unnamed protein product [Parajaminaea phylloscopi]
MTAKAGSAPSQQVLKAQLSDVRSLASLLRPVAIATVASVTISTAGLRVVTEQERCVQAVAYVSSAIFSRFDFRPPSPSASRQHAEYTDDLDSLDPDQASLEFDINLATLLECINIFGGATASASSASSWQQQPNSSGKAWRSGFEPTGDGSDFTQMASKPGPDAGRATTMQIRWKGIGYPLILLLEEQDVVTRCELATFEPGLGVELAYNHDDTQAQAIMTSECLLDALQGIDNAFCSKVTLLFSNTYVASRNGQRPHRTQTPASAASSLPLGRPTFKIISDGAHGTAEVELPNDSAVLERFSCARDTSHAYRYAHFARLNRALQASIRVSLRVSDTGLLSVQLMMPRGTGVAQQSTSSKTKQTAPASTSAPGHGFLEFLIAPLDLDGNDVDEARGSRTPRADGHADATEDAYMSDSREEKHNIGGGNEESGERNGW